jgi:spore coat polysaccharide biosynthesis protein SpsF
MASRRFPGKCLYPIMGRPMLAYQIDRLRRSSAEVVLATSPDPADDLLALWAAELGIRCVRGGADRELISLHAKVARETDADIVVLSGADDPLLEPELVDRLIGAVRGGAVYVESAGWPLGMNAWAWTRQGMEEADAEATDPEERQHVRPWFARRPKRYPPTFIRREPDLYSLRLTVDYREDAELMARLFGALWERRAGHGLDDILETLDRHPEWVKLNAHCDQYFYDLTPLE